MTKMMLGVFGCVAAFDQYVIKGSGLRTFNRDSLQRLAHFYWTWAAEAAAAGSAMSGATWSL